MRWRYANAIVRFAMTVDPSSLGTRLTRARAVAAFSALLLAFAGILVIVHDHYPIQHWMFWRYASYWGMSLYWSVACLTAGHAVLHRLLARTRALLEHLVMSMAMGVLVFFAGMFLAGLIGLYGSVFSVVFPAALTAAGLALERRLWLGLVRHLVRTRRPCISPSSLTWLALAAGLIGLAAIYFTILTPDNASYDARWYHLRLGEHYAGEGALRRFPEGWYQSTLPHLGSLLYCWAFQLPRTNLFDRVEICAHMEFILLLWTMASIPVLVRALVGGTRAPLAALSILLFSKIFGYDSGLTVAADHIAAFWAIPCFVALMRAWQLMSVRNSIVLALMLSGAILTKYQSMYLLPFPIAAFVLRAVWLAARSRFGRASLPAEHRWLAGPAAAALVGVVATAPHWLKNLLWYGDPFYPFLHRYLHVRPWTVDSAWYYDTLFQTQMWRATGTLGERVLASAKAMVTFSIIPNDWGTMFPKIPVFGFLFTASLLVLPFLRKARWVWALSASSLIGVFVWYWTHHQDRYLQIILPWMAAATAATMVLVWRVGLPHRVLLVALIVLQVIWGGDVYFASQHGMHADRSILPVVVRLLGEGNKGDYEDRFRFGEADLYTIGRNLEPGAKVVVHDSHLALGLKRPAVMDMCGWQGGISYGRLKSPHDLYAQLAGYGVTHLVWQTEKSRGHDSLASDLKFFWFARTYGLSPSVVGGQTVAVMPLMVDAADKFPVNVAVLACDGTYAPGVYQLDSLIVPGTGKHVPAEYPRPFLPMTESGEQQLLQVASLLVYDRECQEFSRKVDLTSWALLARRNRLSLYAPAQKPTAPTNH